MTLTFCHVQGETVTYPVSPPNTRGHPRGLARLGFFHVHPDQKPAVDVAIALTPAATPELRGGFWCLPWVATPKDAETARADATSAVLAWANDFLNQFIAKYPEGERFSFPRQEAMARAYVAGTATEAQTRALTIQAMTRGVSLEARAAKIIKKADLFGDLTDYAAGLRSRLETQIPETAPEELQALLNAARDEAEQTAAAVIAAASQSGE